MRKFDLPDNELFALLQKGEQGAMEYLYDKYAPSLFGVICKLAKDDQLSIAILKKSFIKIWHLASSQATLEGRLFTWMHNITRNVTIEELSKNLQKVPEKKPVVYRVPPALTNWGSIVLS